MNKKKLAALAVAGVMTVGVVGGTLAWFTSSDDVTNVFSTATTGVEIYEDFEAPENVVPGDTNTKSVQVKNTASHESFIRVEVTPKWTSVPAGVDGTQLDISMIELNFADNMTSDGDAYEKWQKAEDGLYYYMGKVEADKFTKELLKSVTLSTKADSKYSGAKFEVEIKAEAIQASNDAIASWKNEKNSSIIDKLIEYQTSDPCGVGQLEGVTVTDEHVRGSQN